LPLRDLVEAIYTGNWQRNNQWPPLRDMLRSSPAWHAYITAATLEWVPGRSRVPVAGRRHYGWSRDPQAYPVFTPQHRKCLAYGKTRHRRSKEKIDAVWRNIPGFTVLENQIDEKTQTTGWHIVPEQVAEELMKKVRGQTRE